MNYETVNNCRVYENRRNRVLKLLAKLGISAKMPLATLYIWAKTPTGYTSESFCEKCITEADVVLTPGSAFGKYGEGYIRLSLTIDDVRLDEALHRLSKLKL
jgi:LL-diaminopimelate aminotransferase